VIDLVALLEEGLRAKPPRGDEHLPHMSDNICDRQTWYRRSGAEAQPRDFRTLVKFELGYQFERGIGDILEAALSDRYVIHRDSEIHWTPVPEWNALTQCVIGHADFIAKGLAKWGNSPEDFLLEIKSTSFLRGQVPAAASPWYVEQAAMYAAALNVARFGILVGCRESGKIAPLFRFNLDEQHYDDAYTWREWATERAKEIVTVTDPDRPIPPAKPRTSWACKTCNYTQCERNAAFVEPSTLKKLEESYARHA
jgi:hypothetical protein